MFGMLATLGSRQILPRRTFPVGTCFRLSTLGRLLLAMTTDPSFQTSIDQRQFSSGRTSAEQANQKAADGELMRRVVAGDEAAFASLYSRLSPGLFSMIYQILLDQKESEDVLQEAFVQMWKKASTYDSARSALFTWAVMISRNKAIDRLRGRQRRVRLVEEATTESAIFPPDPATGADILLGQTDERKRIRGALSEIPAPQREAIELAFFSGMTQAEVSAKLQEPLGTVKARIRRGLLALRDLLETTP